MKGKKCFVCGKSGCWSTNHTRDEKDRKIRQYISEFEGGQEDENDDDEVFMTEFGPINGREAVAQLADNSVFHALTGSVRGQEGHETSNFHFDIEPCSDYYDDPEAEAFWAEFEKDRE